MYFDELKVGMSVETAPTVIEKEKMLDFARLYDNIPLHTDEEYAKKTPFGRLIAPGVMSFMSVWAKYLEVSFFGDELLRRRAPRREVNEDRVAEACFRRRRFDRQSNHHGTHSS